MQRREFVKFCAASATAARVPAVAAADATPKFYGRVKLIGSNGAPLKAAAVPVERNLIFHYPFAATPCFLLNLARPALAARLVTADQRSYEWQGGLGPRRSIVAYSAICAHQLAYPTREISFISYRVEKSPRNRHGNVIHCCAEHSQYDPAEGARVLAGPAPQPLAAILLEHDANTDELTAVGKPVWPPIRPSAKPVGNVISSPLLSKAFTPTTPLHCRIRLKLALPLASAMMAGPSSEKAIDCTNAWAPPDSAMEVSEKL